MIFFSSIRFAYTQYLAAAEDLGITRIAGLSWAQWNARLAMPLVTHMQEGAQPILFNSNETSQSPTNEDKYTDSKVNGLATQSSYPCPDCGRYYKLKSSLRNHQKWECGKEPQFQVSSNFIFSFHLFILFNLRFFFLLSEFQCPFCAYKAKQKMHIGRHLERMHKDIVKSDKYEEAAAAAQSTSTTTTFPSNLSLPSSITMTPMPSALNLTNVNTTI